MQDRTLHQRLIELLDENIADFRPQAIQAIKNRANSLYDNAHNYQVFMQINRYKKLEPEVAMILAAEKLFNSTTDTHEQLAIANSVKLAIIMMIEPNHQNIEAVKNDALNNAPGKPARWMTLIGALLTLVGVAGLALVGAASVPVTATSLALSSVSFGSGVGAYISGGALALGITGGILFFNSRQKGLSKALTNLAVETEEREEREEFYRPS